MPPGPPVAWRVAFALAVLDVDGDGALEDDVEGVALVALLADELIALGGLQPHHLAEQVEAHVLLHLLVAELDLLRPPRQEDQLVDGAARRRLLHNLAVPLRNREARREGGREQRAVRSLRLLVHACAVQKRARRHALDGPS